MGSSRHLEHGTRGSTTTFGNGIPSEADPNLYFLVGEVPLILVLYVDLFLTGMSS
jgi:hypothetical protein